MATMHQRSSLALWHALALPLMAVALLLAGCSGSLPTHVDRPVSEAWQKPQATLLGQITARSRPATASPGHSGFSLMGGPEAAYGSRLSLVENAQQTLDLQYYAIHADASTARLLRSIVRAAQRGVRVRVLLDDFHSTGPDAQIMRLAFQPNIEMRMFNPLAGSRGSMLGRTYTLLTDFQRAQQRMHNKMFVADNAMAVVGGRNLGDEYFDASSHGNFVDLDVLVAGPVVQGLSRSFDSYWNNPRAYPVQSLISDKELRDLHAQFQREDKESGTEHALAASQPPGTQAPENAAAIHGDHSLNLRRIPWVWAQAVVLADQPAKIPLESASGPAESAGNPPDATGIMAISQPPLPGKERSSPVLGADSVVDGLLAMIRSARRELLIVSPYFVPGGEIMQAFRQARQRGVRVRVLTNSLASNDAPLAHAGYARHRKELLEIGVELYEMLSTRASVRSVLRSGSTGDSGVSGASRAMLHSKLLVIDSRLTVIGSMNLDLRSQYQNTEIAILIASRSLSQQAASAVDEGLQDGAWKVQLTPGQELIWRAPPGSDRQDEHSEPDASLSLRLMLKLIGPLAPDSLL